MSGRVTQHPGKSVPEDGRAATVCFAIAPRCGRLPINLPDPVLIVRAFLVGSLLSGALHRLS
jgi:hypothetical protein